MKQSIGLIILQIVGIALGFVSVFLVAGKIPSGVYAIVGIYNVITAFMVVFSNTGIETYAIRNVLHWKEEGKNDKIKLIITQAITYRTMLAAIIFIPVIFYTIYISTYKFNGEHLVLFITMGAFGISKAANDSIVLILKAFNKYLASAFITYSVNVFGKLLALFLFFKFGFGVYITTIILLPLFITLPVIFMIKRWISFKGVFSKEIMVNSLKKSKSFALSAYISYVYNFSDQLIVSIFMSPEIMGSFTIAKNILRMGLTFVDNIFDPMIQNLVRVKSDSIQLQKKLKGIFRIKNVLLITSLLFIPVVALLVNRMIIVLNISHYPYLNIFIIFIYIAQISYLAMKLKFNFIMFFYPSSYYLRLTLINAVLFIIFFVTILSINIKVIFLYILLVNITMLIYTNSLYRRNEMIINR